jgi:hypothetical protein
MAEPQPEIPDALELAANQAIAICDDDVCAALRAALVANSFLQSEVERLTHAVSVGYMRGKVSPARQASEKVAEGRPLDEADASAH